MKNVKTLMVFVSLAITSIVYAQPGTVVGTGSGQPTDVVTISVDYLGTGSTVAGVQMDINFDNTNLTADLTNCGGTLGGANISCTDNTTFIRLIGFDGGLNEIPSGSLGSIDFTIAPGATVPSTLALTVSGELYGDSGGAPVAPSGTVDGSIDVVAGPQPDYSSAPVAGTTLALNGNVGGANPTSSVAISNVGPVGAPNLTGTCSLSGGDAASFSITTAAAINVAQGAAAQTMTVDCDASAVTGATLNASLDCTHNGDGTTTASPASYPLTCDIAAITPQYNSTPVVGSTLALGQILQGGTNPTTSIDIDNNAGDATTTLTGTCTSSAPFLVTNGNFSVLQGAAAATVNVACDASAAPAAYTDTLSCTHNGSNTPSPATYPVSCEVLAAAAAGSQNPADGTTLNFVAPPGGSITSSVTFSEVGGQGVAITDLVCSVTGPDFAITSPLGFPATVPAAGTLPVIVTFTDPAVAGPFNDTLVCSYSDGTGAVNVSYPLSGAVRAVVVPTLSWMGYAAMMFALLLVGFFGIRRKA